MDLILPQISILHFFIAPDGRAICLDDGGTPDHDHDPLSDGKNEFHIMFAEKDGKAALGRKPLDKRDATPCLLWGHAGSRLVQNEKFRLSAEDDSDLKDLSVPMRQ